MAGVTGVLILITVFAFLTQREIYQMLGKAGYPAAFIPGLSAGVLVSLGAYFAPRFNLDLLTVYGVAVALVAIVFLFQQPEQRRFASIAATIVGITLAPLMLGFLTQTVLLAGFGLTIWIIAVAKFADVGGLLVGMAIGRHKLAPKLSPKKTWEGLGGGIIASILIGMGSVALFPQYFPDAFTPWLAGFIAIPVALAGISADLFESCLKREAGVKDSGKLFPGIGGAFDLTDSFIFAAPIAFLCLRPVIG